MKDNVECQPKQRKRLLISHENTTTRTSRASVKVTAINRRDIRPVKVPINTRGKSIKSYQTLRRCCCDTLEFFALQLDSLFLLSQLSCVSSAATLWHKMTGLFDGKVSRLVGGNEWVVRRMFSTRSWNMAPSEKLNSTNRRSRSDFNYSSKKQLR